MFGSTRRARKTHFPRSLWANSSQDTPQENPRETREGSSRYRHPPNRREDVKRRQRQISNVYLRDGLRFDLDLTTESQAMEKKRNEAPDITRKNQQGQRSPKRWWQLASGWCQQGCRSWHKRCNAYAKPWDFVGEFPNTFRQHLMRQLFCQTLTAMSICENCALGVCFENRRSSSDPCGEQFPRHLLF